MSFSILFSTFILVQAGPPLAKPDSSATSKSGKAIEQAYLHYCKNEKDAGDTVLKNVLEKNPSNPKAYFLLNTFFPDQNQKFVDATLSRIKNGETPKDEMERLIFVHALTQSLEPDLSKIARLLDFKSNIPEIEGDRLLWSAMLDWLQGRNDQAFIKSEESLKFLGAGIPDPVMNLVFLQVSQADLVTQQEGYRKNYATHFAKNNPYLSYFRGNLEMMAGANSFGNMHDAYLGCKEDENLAIAYALALRADAHGEHRSWKEDRIYEQLEKSKAIFKNITNQKYYHPEVDMYLAEIIMWLNRGAIGFFSTGGIEGHLAKAKAAMPYLAPYGKDFYAKIEEYVHQQLWRQRIAAFVILILLVGAGLLIHWSIRSGRKPIAKKDPHIENLSKLEEAERALENSLNEKRVQIASFESSSGYRLDDVIELTLFLGQEGIQADYNVMNTVGVPEAGALEVYSIRVPIDQAKRAKKLLAEKKRSA